MLKKTITYEDYDGNTRTEDHYFNFTKAELAEMNFNASGGLAKILEKMIAEQDIKRLGAFFKDLIVKSYGEKTLDGKYHIKNEELTTAFLQSGAYSEFFMELLSDADMAAAFVNGIIPK